MQDVSFKARKGEIVGLAGLDGSSRTETLENIFGVATRKDGVIKLDGKEGQNRNARGESIKNGFALLTENVDCHRYLRNPEYPGEQGDLQSEET